MTMTPNSGDPVPQPQTVWGGLNPEDRHWFQAITITIFVILSGIIINNILINRPPDKTISDALGPALGYMAAAFVVSGAWAWMILVVKEGIMSIGYAIRRLADRKTEEFQQKLVQQGREQGIEQGREQTIRNMIAKAEADGNQAEIDIIRKYAGELNGNGQSG